MNSNLASFIGLVSVDYLQSCYPWAYLAKSALAKLREVGYDLLTVTLFSDNLVIIQAQELRPTEPPSSSPHADSLLLFGDFDGRVSALNQQDSFCNHGTNPGS